MNVIILATTHNTATTISLKLEKLLQQSELTPYSRVNLVALLSHLKNHLKRIGNSSDHEWPKRIITPTSNIKIHKYIRWLLVKDPEYKSRPSTGKK